MLALALVLAASPVDVQLRNAALLGPSSRAPIGWALAAPVRVVSWPRSTLPRVRHDGPLGAFEVLVDLSREGTEVEARVRQPVRALGVGAWPVVLKAGAVLALQGHDAQGWQVAFLPEHHVPFSVMTLEDDARPVTRAVRPATPLRFRLEDGGSGECAVDELFQTPTSEAPTLRLEPSRWTCLRAGDDVGGFSPVRAETDLLEVSGWVRRASVRCDGVSSGLGLSGLGAGAGDGLLEAEAATLPKGTKLLDAAGGAVVTTLIRPARALALDGGAWRLEPLVRGSLTVQWSRVFLEPSVAPFRETQRWHGVGSSGSTASDWPRPRAATE
ncbi:MAG: hypothetical protein SFW67_36230 [Myxococcaceae bacterium]|nr:hypothetical protein [Myxococcaceae bacterium]